MKMMSLGLALLSAQTLPLAPASAEPLKQPATVQCTGPALPAGTRCGILEVPEDRRRPAGRKVPIHFAVVPGTGEDRPAPIFFLAGGPGQSAIDSAPIILAELKTVNSRADVVLFDQRGTGRSAPLACPEGFDVLSKGDDDVIRRCAAALGAKADLRRYLTDDAVMDLDAVRAALGYPKVSIAAASYGVRPALLYMRRHPGRVRSALLRAASAPDFNIIREGLGNATAELERLVAHCERDSDCRAAFPQLRAQLRGLEARLAAKPEQVSVGGKTIAVGPELFLQTLYAMMLSAPTRQQIPFLIATAETKGFAPLAPLLATVTKALYDSMPVGLYLSILCSEDAPRMTGREFGTEKTGLGSMGARLHAMCGDWPRRPVPSALFKPLRSRVPTLILSGDVDPATTVAAAERLDVMLRNARHIVMSGTAHGPLFPECVRQSVGTFLETARLPSASPSCAGNPLPPFRTR